jgi:hypothetical protein
MGMMIIRHKVRDYGLWRPIFNENAEMQKAAGLTNPRVYHSADSNKSEIVVVFDTEDTKRAPRLLPLLPTSRKRCRRPALSIHRRSISLSQLIRRSDSLSASMSAADVGDSRRGHFNGCRNELSSAERARPASTAAGFLAKKNPGSGRTAA